MGHGFRNLLVLVALSVTATLLSTLSGQAQASTPAQSAVADELSPSAEEKEPARSTGAENPARSVEADKLARARAAATASGVYERTDPELERLAAAADQAGAPGTHESSGTRESTDTGNVVAPAASGISNLLSSTRRTVTTPYTLADWPAGLGPRPESRAIPAATMEAARAVFAAESVAPERPEEDRRHVQEELREIAARRAGTGGIANGDDDSAHYARGSTLVMHVFVNHMGGTWSTSEMDEAGAKATLAKEYWLSEVPMSGQFPNLANLHFDHEGLDAYWSVTATVGSTIPESGMGSDMMEVALAALGIADLDGDDWRVDDYTIALQNALGGWDNVILVFQPADIDGRAWASYSFARTALYSNSSAMVFAHEWGHLFGACDEYVEEGTCNNGLNCGQCQGWYTTNPNGNWNCDLLSCGFEDICLMKANHPELCIYSRHHVSWRDVDLDTVLDPTRRRLIGELYVESVELEIGESVLSSETTANWVVAQREPVWSVIGLRNPSGAAHEVLVYGDNNLNHLFASSFSGNQVEFVAADYGHMPPENDFIMVDRVVGSGNYRMEFEVGTEEVYSDGVERTSSWIDGDVVRVFDLPLFGGDAITFVLDPTSSLDLGMALFRSDGGVYRAGRSAAQWTRDVAGAGDVEVINYLVPEDDVYGLVLWSNGPDTGTATLKIGPTTVPLAEEQTFETNASLGLYRYTPNASSWSFIGARPGTAGGDVSLRLFDDASFTTPLEESSGHTGLEFIVADYNHAPADPEYARVNLVGGGTQQVEWEHDNDLIGGFTTGSWGADDLGKAWDVFLEGGNTYFFRTYEPGGPRGLHLFYSGTGDLYHTQDDAIASSVSQPPSANGEWFSEFVWLDDWFGLVMSSNSAVSSNYQLWYGPQTSWLHDEPQVHHNEVVWGTHLTWDTGTWAVAACRSTTGASSLSLFGDDSYGQLEASDSGAPVSFVVMDYNHETIDSQFLRARNITGGLMVVEFDGGQDSFVFPVGGGLVEERGWVLDRVVEAFDLQIPGSRPIPQDVVIEVVPTSGSLDLGVALFRSPEGPYKASRQDAVVLADDGGVGEAEVLQYTSTNDDQYGLVVWSNTTSGAGTYEIRIYDPATADAPGPGVDDGPALPAVPSTAVLTANPFEGEVRWSVELPEARPVDLSVHDVTGRVVYSMPRETFAAGRFELAWNGMDSAGRDLAPGVYFARVRFGDASEVWKLVRR